MTVDRPFPGPLSEEEKTTPSPRELGMRMPAEWEPHGATWLSFPHNKDSWPGRLVEAQRAFAKMVTALAASEPVHLNVNDDQMEAHARRLLDDASAGGEIHFHHFPTNDAWCRDHGAIFVRRYMLPACTLHRPSSGQAQPASGIGKLPAPKLALNWQYNAWGEKYPPYDLDNAIPNQMADALGVPCVDIDMILEGGSIDVNGQGLLLTTESCLLNENRNPRLTRKEIESRLRETLGVDKVLWLGEGIVGDDTDGHIDDLTRFVSPDTVVTAVESDPGDENYRPLQENLTRLREMTNTVDDPLEIVELPMPSPVFHQGQRLPASYANFYIANRVVLLPTYGCNADEVAREILASQFPTRRVVGIDCTELVWGLGACHCLTQQVPA